MKIIRLAILLSIVMSTGCATIVNNKPQAIKISTNENKTAIAKIKMPDREAYKTTIPDILYVSPSSFNPLEINIEDPCYQQQRVRVDTSLEPMFWANIFNAFYGAPIDYLTGNMWNYQSRVNIQLIQNQNSTQDCNEETRNLKDYTNIEIPKPTLKRHRLSGGWTSKTHSKRYPSSYSGFGGYLEYSFRINREFMANARFQSNSSFDLDYSQNTDINTNQTVYAFSLRHYLNPKTSFYAGLGVAQITVEQEYIDYSYTGNWFRNDNITKVTGETSAIFLDFGWASRDKKLSFSINGMLDLADLRLASPDFKYRDKTISFYNGKPREAEAINKFRNAGIISNINFGLALTF